jgi:transposase-like protein
MADTADRILEDLRRRRDELRPLAEELKRIEAAIDALERLGGTTASAPAAAPVTGRRRGRPRKGEPNRADQFLALVQNGGTSVSAAAKELGIGPNYLYRIAGTLENEGTIRKEGRDYVMAVDGAPEPDADLVADEGVNEGTREIAGN